MSLRSALSIFAAALCAVALLSAGCTAPREATGVLPSAYPNHSFADIQQALGRGTDTLRALRAETRLSVTTPELSGSFSAQMRARRGATGDSLYMQLSKFGIGAARLLVTPDSFFVYDALRNELTYGALASAGGVLPAPLRTGRAFENLIGVVTPASALDWSVRPSTAAEGENRYVLASTAGQRERTLVVDPSRWRALRYTERVGEDAVVEERAFSEFGRFSGVFVPRRVTLRQPQAGTEASVYYRDLTLNPADLPPFELDVPSSTERILVAR